jgi:hypothetical protein
VPTRREDVGIFTYDADDVIQKIGVWRPSSASNEKAYEELLYRHLHEQFPAYNFIRQYTVGKTIADIFVDFDPNGCRVALELKANLSDRPEFHRLCGQLFEYAQVWKCDCVLVLCGETEPSLRKLASAYVDMLNNRYSSKARLVEVVGLAAPLR